MHDPKPRPNAQRCEEVLRQMTPAQRLDKAIELTEMVRDCLRIALRRRHPDLGEAELHRLYLRHLAECHNKNY